MRKSGIIYKYDVRPKPLAFRFYHPRGRASCLLICSSRPRARRPSHGVAPAPRACPAHPGTRKAPGRASLTPTPSVIPKTHGHSFGLTLHFCSQQRSRGPQGGATRETFPTTYRGGSSAWTGPMSATRGSQEADGQLWWPSPSLQPDLASESLPVGAMLGAQTVRGPPLPGHA